MTRTALLSLLLTCAALPAVADCATAGLRVRCIYVGPDPDQQRGDIGARFVTASPEINIVIAGPRHRDPRPHFRPDRRIRNGVPARNVYGSRHDIIARGDRLPDDSLILMNPTRYGLPRPRDGWTYFAVDRDIYRAELRSRRVLDYVNPHITRR